MPSHEQQFVLDVLGCFVLQTFHFMCKALPLRLVVMIPAGMGMCAVDEAKIGGLEIKGARIRRRIVLQEVAGDGAVINERVRFGIRCDEG